MVACQKGAELVLECLLHIDLTLLSVISQKDDLQMFALVLSKHLNSFGTLSGPVSESILLFDYYIAKGFHSIVYIVLAQLVDQRNIFLESEKTPSALLETFGSIQAKKLFVLADVFENALPSHLKQKIIKHIIE